MGMPTRECRGAVSMVNGGIKWQGGVHGGQTSTGRLDPISRSTRHRKGGTCKGTTTGASTARNGDAGGKNRGGKILEGGRQGKEKISFSSSWKSFIKDY